MRPSPPDAEIGYSEFGAWYDRYRAEVLEPALAVASETLAATLTDVMTDRDLARIRSTTGRVKSKRRTWRKIHQPRYGGQIASVDDIPAVVDDLVGLRVTCINLRDIDMVQTALDALPRVPTGSLWLDPASERDYVAEPKASGYRGWHVNIGVTVGERPVVCELQVRTLLQDSWGELTHEDTYSKDGALPPLVDVLSTRMADLLGILDDIAEDLRTELDRIDQAVVEVSDDRGALADEVLGGQAADAAVLLRNRWMALDRPTDLAALAWALQREFGAEVSDDWFGHGSFKRFLRHAVPEGEISTGRQAYLLPRPEVDSSVFERGSGVDSDESDGPSDDAPGPVAAPGPARQLRRIDPEFPLLSGPDWAVTFEMLAESWRRVKPVDAAASTVNRLTRSARDLARAGGTSLSRRNLDYVAKALLATDWSRTQASSDPTGPPPPGAAALAARFADQTIQRMMELRILDSEASRGASKVERWLTGRVEA